MFTGDNMLVSNQHPTCPARKSRPVTCHLNICAALPLDVHPRPRAASLSLRETPLCTTAVVPSELWALEAAGNEHRIARRGHTPKAASASLQTGLSTEAEQQHPRCSGGNIDSKDNSNNCVNDCYTCSSVRAIRSRGTNNSDDHTNKCARQQ